MSLLKKLGAVALGTASVAGGAAALTIKEALENAGKKLGNNCITGSDGVTRTSGDFKNAANQCNDSIFKKGIEKSVELWKDED